MEAPRARKHLNRFNALENLVYLEEEHRRSPHEMIQ